MNQIIMDSCILLHPNMVDECSPSKLAQDISQGFGLMRMKPLFMLGKNHYNMQRNYFQFLLFVQILWSLEMK